MKSRRVIATRAPYTVRVILYFANARPTERTWRRTLLQPFRHIFPELNLKQLPEAPTFGVSTLEHLQAILDDLRASLRPMVDAASLPSRAAMEQAVLQISSEARLKFQRFHWNHGRRRLEPVWGNESGTAREMLYSYLALALHEVSPASLHRCRRCEKYFFDPSERPKAFCSARCRTIDNSLRFQRRHRSKYRAYHRDLMRRVREKE